MFGEGEYGYWYAALRQRPEVEVALTEAIMSTVGGVDTYYDYDEQRWKYRRLGGGPVRLKSRYAKPTEAIVETGAKGKRPDCDAPPARESAPQS